MGEVLGVSCLIVVVVLGEVLGVSCLNVVVVWGRCWVLAA